MAPMPVYEFECEECGERFEELTSSETRSLACPRCASTRTRRLLSPVSLRGASRAGPASGPTNRGGASGKRPGASGSPSPSASGRKEGP